MTKPYDATKEHAPIPRGVSKEHPNKAKARAKRDRLERGARAAALAAQFKG